MNSDDLILLLDAVGILQIEITKFKDVLRSVYKRLVSFLEKLNIAIFTPRSGSGCF